MLTTYRGCSAFESACALPAGVIRGFESSSRKTVGFPQLRPYPDESTIGIPSGTLNDPRKNIKLLFYPNALEGKIALAGPIFSL
jgi:hypothetical protein